jgi:CRISPR-associated protein Cas1
VRLLAARARQVPNPPVTQPGPAAPDPHGAWHQAPGRHGALVIRDGFTHYPQTVSEHRLFPGVESCPRIIVIDGSGGLSFDVMTWLSEQQIPLIRIDWKGNAVSVIGGGQFTNPERVAAQIDAKRSGKALGIAGALIREKIENAIATLEAVIPPSPARELAVMKHQRDARGLAVRPPKSIAALLGIEGRTAQAYFAAWNSVPIRWKGLTCRATIKVRR